VTATGLVFMDELVGPTDANGEATLVAVPFPTGEGLVTVVAEVVPPDLTGPDGIPDGVPDQLPCNTCTVQFQIINPICDDDGAILAVTYFDVNDMMKMIPGGG